MTTHTPCACGVYGGPPGGVPTLLRKHPWLQQQEDASIASSSYAGLLDMGDHGANEEGEDEAEDAPPPVVDELPLAEVQWRQAHSDADRVRGAAVGQAEGLWAVRRLMGGVCGGWLFDR